MWLPQAWIRKAASSDPHLPLLGPLGARAGVDGEDPAHVEGRTFEALAELDDGGHVEAAVHHTHGAGLVDGRLTGYGAQGDTPVASRCHPHQRPEARVTLARRD